MLLALNLTVGLCAYFVALYWRVEGWKRNVLWGGGAGVLLLALGIHSWWPTEPKRPVQYVATLSIQTAPG